MCGSPLSGSMARTRLMGKKERYAKYMFTAEFCRSLLPSGRSPILLGSLLCHVVVHHDPLNICHVQWCPVYGDHDRNDSAFAIVFAFLYGSLHCNRFLLSFVSCPSLAFWRVQVETQYDDAALIRQPSKSVLRALAAQRTVHFASGSAYMYGYYIPSVLFFDALRSVCSDGRQYRCAYIGGRCADSMAIVFISQISVCVLNPSGNSLMLLTFPLSNCVQKDNSTSRITLHRSSCRGVFYGHLYGQVCFGPILLYLVYRLQMYVYASLPHMSSSCKVPAPTCWWPPPSFHNMHFNIAYAQFACARLELSCRSFFVGHVCLHMLDLCGCLQNSCNALNSHFEILDYQMSPYDSDDE